MGIRAEKKVSITFSGTFEVAELIDKVAELCDNNIRDWTGHVSGVYGGDQRDPATVTLSFTKKNKKQISEFGSLTGES